MKNIDKIRQMNSEELAELMVSDCLYCSYKDIGWLCEGECKLVLHQLKLLQR